MAVLNNKRVSNASRELEEKGLTIQATKKDVTPRPEPRSPYDYSPDRKPKNVDKSTKAKDGLPSYLN